MYGVISLGDSGASEKTYQVCLNNIVDILAQATVYIVLQRLATVKNQTAQTVLDEQQMHLFSVGNSQL